MIVFFIDPAVFYATICNGQILYYTILNCDSWDINNIIVVNVPTFS